MVWFQNVIKIRTPGKGCFLITKNIIKGCPALASVEVGMLNLFLKHTSASLTINENADPTVRSDLNEALNHIVPEDWHEGPHAFFDHVLEGPDDMTGEHWKLLSKTSHTMVDFSSNL